MEGREGAVAAAVGEEHAQERLTERGRLGGRSG